MYYLIIIAYGVAGWHTHSIEINNLNQCMIAKAKIERINDQLHAECVEK